MDGPVWFTSTGSFEIVLEIRKEQDELRTVLENIDYVTANVEREFHIKDLTEEGGVLQLKCSRQLDIDSSTMLRQLEKENFSHHNLIRQLKTLSEWERKTREQLFNADERVEELLS